MELTQQFGRMIRHRRRSLNLSVSQLALLSRISIPRIYQIEHGKSCPNLATALRIAEVLDINLHRITTAMEVQDAASTN